MDLHQCRPISESDRDEKLLHRDGRPVTQRLLELFAAAADRVFERSRDVIPALQRRRQAVEVPHVVAIDVDVDEAAHLAVVEIDRT